MKQYKTTDKLYVTHYSAKLLLEELQNAIKRYGKDNVSFEVAKECEDCSDYERAVAYLFCVRDCTDEENSKRHAAEEEQQNKIKAMKLAQYKALKRELGNEAI